MTPAARVQSAIEILDEVLAGAPTEQALIRWARQNRFAGSKDRAAVRDHVFQAVRCKRSFAVLGGAETGRGLMIGQMREIGGDLSEIFSGTKYGPDALTEDERAEFGKLDQSQDAIKVDLPDWLWEQFEESLNDKAFEAAQSLRHRSKVFLRANIRKASQQQALAALANEGIEAIPHWLSKTALEVTANPNRINQSSTFKEGLVELQDAASQAVCDFLSLPKSGQILDFCSGGGGKALAMAAATNARIVAHDADPRRMSDLPNRSKRAGVSIEIQEKIAKGSQFDLVLCDVPCSGSGSWRRAPDGKWLLTQEKLDGLLKVQAKILADCAELVVPGGELAYATCSVLKDENRVQINTFLKSNSNWRMVEDRQFLPQDGGDGFYVARLTLV
jgi:16S rRNA (cytosine967-C5)-methyltransferase